ncbi:hypothetical protein Q5752_004146 [Cryptotrichosporon argae]
MNAYRFTRRALCRLVCLPAPPTSALGPALLPLPRASASSSRVTLPALSPSGTYHGKGKGRVFDVHDVWEPVTARLVQRRGFYATPRRDAVVGLAMLFKSGTLLTAATAVSRVLLTLFPLATFGTMRFNQVLKWMQDESLVPKASAEAVQFWKLWCEGERPVRITKTEATELADMESDGQGRRVLADGRVAYDLVLPEHVRRFRRSLEDRGDPSDPKVAYRNRRSKVANSQDMRFFLPPLSPAGAAMYDRLSESQQQEVTQLRRYWSSIGLARVKLRHLRWALAFILGLPIALLLAAWGSGLERVPFTGRWRLIILSPEEEDAVSTSLEGANWFRSVNNLLTTEDKAAPPAVPLDDWRWPWVLGLLRRLEAGVVAAVREEAPPYPRIVTPPAPEYPLRPRPRPAVRLHAALPGGEADSGREHLELGPPYNIVILDSPERNAFSYGFGGKAAGGIVIFTGLLDEILASHRPDAPAPPPPPSSFLGSLFAPPQPAAPPPRPTDEQTLHLAAILAHEMGHLLLSHHLETLSQQQVLWPSALGFSVDLIRAMLWPLTVMLGPTVNDALANIGKTSTEEISQRYGHIGFQFKHEYEADSAALRILAQAGLDPRQAVDYFAQSITCLDEIQAGEREKDEWWSLFKLWTWATHPSPDARVEAMRAELARWDGAEAGA